MRIEFEPMRTCTPDHRDARACAARDVATVLVAACALACAVVPGAYAQPAAQGSLDPVTVTATRIEQRSFDVPAAIDSVDAHTALRAQPRVNLSEALGRVPGVQVQNRQNFAQDLQISSRGFGSRASFGVRGVRLAQDGIPFTMPDGQGQSGLFDLDAAARVEVLKGPFAALYGNSSGGLVTLFTEEAPQRPTLRGQFGVGSDDSRKAVLAGGDTIGRAGMRFDLSRFRTDGYRDHSRTRRDLAGARLGWAGEDDTLTLNVTLLEQPDTQDPLGLTQAQLDADRRQAGTGALAFDTRKSVDHRQAGLDWRRRTSADSELRVRVYGGDRRTVQFLAFRGDGAGSSGGVVDLDRGFGGVNGQWTRTLRLAQGRLDATLGVDLDHMQERRKGFVNESGAAGALRRDESDAVRAFDQYALLEWWFAPSWKLAGGVRRSNVRFRIEDDFIEAGNPDDSGRVRYTATSPVVGLLYAFSDTANVYASVGRGFETPTLAELAYRPDGVPGPNFALRASRSTNYEAGIKILAARATRLNLAVFRADTRNDIVPAANVAGRTTFRNAARTARHGVELGAESELGAGFSAWLAWTWMRAEFRDYRALDGSDLSGNALPGVARSAVLAELLWRHRGSGFAAGIEARWNDEIRVDDANSAAARAYTVLNWHAALPWRGGGWLVEPFVRIDNVFGRRYVGSVIVNAANGRFFEPAPRRTYVAGVKAEFAF